MCRGEAQGLPERRIIPMASILLNSSLAEDNLSGGRRRALALIGRPVVFMKYSMPCLVGIVANLGVVISGKFESNLLYSFDD